MILQTVRHALSNRRNLSTGMFTAGRLACMGLRMAGGLLLVRLLPPADLGFFNKNTVVLGYLVFFTLGVFSGLSRELPFNYGKGNLNAAHSLAGVANAFALVLGGIAFILFGGIAAIYGLDGEYWKSAVWFSNSIAAFEVIYDLYLGVTFRTRQDFVRLASIDVLMALVSLVSLVLVWRWHYYGLCMRAVFVAVVTVAVMYYYRPVRVAPQWELRHLWQLFKTGLPIYTTGYLVSWWGATLSTTWIALKLDAFQMGLYSFPVFVYGAVTLFSNSFNQVYYPRLVECYAKQESIRALFRMLVKPIAFLLVINGAMLAAGWLLMPYAVHLLAPKYLQSVVPAQFMLLNLVIYWLDPLLKIFYVIKKTRAYFFCIVVGIITNLAFLFLLESRMDPLLAVITANVMGRAVYVVLSVCAVWFMMSRSEHRVKAEALA